jgi:hypothetical protein
LNPLTKTDVLDPKALSMGIPAFSKAWYTFSRTNRCCGSKVKSSFLEMLKKGPSKNAGSSERKCPPWTWNYKFDTSISDWLHNYIFYHAGQPPERLTVPPCSGSG